MNLIPALPELFVTVMTCVILLVGLYTKKESVISYYLTQITLVFAAIITAYLYMKINATSVVFAFNNLFVVDRLAFILKEFIYISIFLAFMYSRYYNDDNYIPSNEFYVLGLLSMLGMMVLVSGHNFLTLYLGLELLSLPIYAMVALVRAKQRCVEAAMKYFVIGALASGLLLYGMSMIFGACKSLDITQIALAIAVMPLQNNLILLFGLVFMIAGVAFKLGAAPFHMWVPDVYDGAPNSVTLFLSSAPKLAAFGLVIRLLVNAMPTLAPEWSQMLIVMAILSIIIGNVAAIVQTSIKRMLAYSSIAHIGYMLLGLACATPRGYGAALFYMISYTIMTLGAFGMVVLMSRDGVEANDIDDYKGLNTRNPWLAFIMLLIMFSMAGVPPIVGFIAKVSIFEALIQVNLVWLAAFAVLFSVIGAFYYLRVVKVMYFEESDNTDPVRYPFDLKCVMSANGLAVLLLGVAPGALFTLCHMTFS